MSILCNYTLYHNSDYGDQNYSNINYDNHSLINVYTGLRCIISEDCYRISNINYDNHSLINVYTGGIIMPNDFIVRPKCTDKKEDKSITMTIRLERELQEQYDDLSAKSGRSRNELMCMALRYALDNLKFIE